MMAWTSPALTLRSMPLRISRSSTRACRFLISSIIVDSVFPMVIGALTLLHPDNRHKPVGRANREYHGKRIIDNHAKLGNRSAFDVGILTQLTLDPMGSGSHSVAIRRPQ